MDVGSFLAGIALTIFIGFIAYKVLEKRNKKPSGSSGGRKSKLPPEKRK